jgi:hypothetical protein
MNTVLKKLFLILIISFSPIFISYIFSQPPGPGPGPGPGPVTVGSAPIDGGMGILFVLSVAYSLKKFFISKKNKLS